MSMAQRLAPFVHGGRLALVAYLPYRPVIALSRRLTVATGGPHPGALAARRRQRVAALLGDWDPAGAVADLQRPCLGR